MTIIDEPQNLHNAPIDKERLRQKYLEERNKRLRADGNDQYIQVKDQLAHYLDDPYTPRHSARAEDRPRHLCLHRRRLCRAWPPRRGLSEAGIEDVRIIEKGGDFGGTWYWNRYPGAQCDTASMVYMPLLEETGHMPTEKYAHAPEILAHCRRIGQQYGLYDNALFHTEVTSLDVGRSRIALDHPHQPRRCLHRAVHRHGHGAAARAETAGHRGHRGLQGTFVPHQPLGLRLHRRRSLGRADGEAGGQARRHHRHRRDLRAVRAASGARRKELYVFQRTPSSVDVRANAPIDPEWFSGDRDARLAAALAGEFYREPGRRQRAKKIWCRTAGPICRGGSAPRSCSCRASSGPRRTCWRRLRTPTSKRWRKSAPGSTPSSRTARPPRSSRPGIASSASGRASMTRICRPSTRRARIWSTPTARASREITENGVVVAGKEYQLDCIIYASGFEVGTEYKRRAGFDLTGRGGVKLSEHWADGHAHQARHPRPRFSERLLRAADAGRQSHLQRAAQSDRGRQDDRADGRACARRMASRKSK